MIRKLSREEFLTRIVAEDEAVFFVFKDEKCCLLDKWDSEISVGLELVTREEVVVKEGEVVIVPTGVKWAAPSEFGLYLSVLPRSGLSKNTPLRIPNAPGTIEPTYRNEIGILLECVPISRKESFDYKGIKCKKEEKWEVEIPAYSRLAQAVVNVNFLVQMRWLYHKGNPYVPARVFYCVDREIFDYFHEIAPSKRGLNGFGSTGV